MIDEPFQGPQILWDTSELKRMVKHFGFDVACELLAEKVFDLEYVRKMVRQLLDLKEGEGKLQMTQQFFNGENL